MNIENFSQLFEAFQRFRGGRWVFRGVYDPSFNLIPKVGRGQIVALEQRIFEGFCREVPGYGTNLPTDVWELLAVGQHHGLPTRLLDWTENPLVAAFFACGDLYDREGVIYAMKNLHVLKDMTTSPFDIQRVVRYRPRGITARIRAQSGLFTVHPQPSIPLPLGKGDGIDVQQIVISRSYKSQLIWDLARFGVHRAMLFPDIDGLANHLRWMYETYDPGKAPDGC